MHDFENNLFGDVTTNSFFENELDRKTLAKKKDKELKAVEKTYLDASDSVRKIEAVQVMKKPEEPIIVNIAGDTGDEDNTVVVEYPEITGVRYPVTLPVFDDAKTAKAKLDDGVGTFFREGEIFNGRFETRAKRLNAIVHVLKASAGIGKTESVLRFIAENLADKSVLYLVPSLELGRELELKAIGFGIGNVNLIRGRSADQSPENLLLIKELGDDYIINQIYNALPEEEKLDGGKDEKGKPTHWIVTEKKMCAKSSTAEELAMLSQQVSKTLCIDTKKNADGEEITYKCPFYNHCPYQGQTANRPGLYIGAHNYLRFNVELISQEKFDFIIIDESFWPVMSRTTFVNHNELVGDRQIVLPEKANDDDRDLIADFMRLREETRDAIMSGNFNLSYFREKFGEDFRPLCAKAKAIEYRQMEEQKINPSMKMSEVKEGIQKMKASKCHSYARFWTTMEEEALTDRHAFHAFERGSHGVSGEAGYWIMTHSSVKYRNVPTLIIDANARLDIIEQFYPENEITFKEINVENQNVEIWQANNTPFPRCSIFQSENAEEDDLRACERNRTRLHNFAKLVAMHSAETVAEHPERKPLLVTYLPVEKALEKEHPDFKNFYDVEHFGNLRGKDGWKHASSIIVAGRNITGLKDIEDLMRCIFYKSKEPMTFLYGKTQIVNGVETKDKFTKEIRPILFSDGTAQDCVIDSHPDPRGRAIIEQIREAELTQAIARVRPVHRSPDNPCRIIILTNVPLPGIIVDKSFQYTRNNFHRGFEELLEGVVFETSKEASEFFPEIWKTANARNMNNKRFSKVVFVKTDKEFFGKAVFQPVSPFGQIDADYVTFYFAKRRTHGIEKRKIVRVCVSDEDKFEDLIEKLAERFPNLELS